MSEDEGTHYTAEPVERDASLPLLRARGYLRDAVVALENAEVSMREAWGEDRDDMEEVVRELRKCASQSAKTLSQYTGLSLERVVHALAALDYDGVVRSRRRAWGTVVWKLA